MRALTWQGNEKVEVTDVPDPRIQEANDVIIRVTSTAICGSDLHLYGVLGPYLKPGDVLGHEAMGIVEEAGAEITRLAVGDRVVIPFNISCGYCWMCSRGLFAQCETTQVRSQGKGAALFGYTSLYGSVPAARPSTCGYRRLSSGRSRSRTEPRMNSFSTCPTSCPPPIRRSRTPTRRRVGRWPSWASGRWGSSRCASPGSSVSGVYGGEVDPMPMMEMFDRGVQLRMGQAHVRRWLDDLMPLVSDDADPLGVRQFATHHLSLEDAPRGYEIFRDKAQGCIKVVLQP